MLHWNWPGQRIGGKCRVCPIVSSDVSYSTYSSTFDSLATMVLGGNASKTLSWYDAGYGYAHRAVDLIKPGMVVGTVVAPQQISLVFTVLLAPMIGLPAVRHAIGTSMAMDGLISQV